MKKTQKHYTKTRIQSALPCDTCGTDAYGDRYHDGEDAICFMCYMALDRADDGHILAEAARQAIKILKPGNRPCNMREVNEAIALLEAGIEATHE